MSTLRRKRRLGKAFCSACPNATAHELEFITPSRKAPGKRSKLDEKAMRLLAKDLQQRPWATHSQRAQFLFALCGVKASEATVCRAVGRLCRSRKKDPERLHNGTSF